MKKIFIGLGVLAVLAVAVAIIVLRPGREAGPRTWYAAYLPADTLATVSLTDLNGLTDSFPRTPLGRFLARPTMDRILAELRLAPETVRRYDAFHDTVAGILTNPAFRTIFGDDAVLALLPPDPDRLRRDPEGELARTLVAFATTSSSRTMERLARLIMGRKVSRENVDGIGMTRIRLDGGRSVYACARGNALLVALAPGPIVRCLRVRAANADSLRSAPSFTAAVGFWRQTTGQPLLDSYASGPGLRRLLGAMEGEEDGGLAPMLCGIGYLASSVRRGDRELRIASRAGFRAGELDPRVSAMLASASANTTLGLVTEEMLAYYWSSSLDEAMLGAMLASTPGMDPRAADARLRREPGLSLARIGAAFGPQYGVILHRITDTGLFPVPRLTLFVRVRDHRAAAEVVDALRRDLERRGMAREEREEFHGRTIYSWPILPGEATRPALVLTGDMLYAANGRPLLRAILQRDPAAPLPESVARAMGSDMAVRIGRADHGALILRPARLAGEIGPLADWLAATVAAAGKVSLATLKQETLRLLRSLDIVTWTGSTGKNSASSETLFRSVPEQGGP